MMPEVSKKNKITYCRHFSANCQNKTCQIFSGLCCIMKISVIFGHHLSERVSGKVGFCSSDHIFNVLRWLNKNSILGDLYQNTSASTLCRNIWSGREELCELGLWELVADNACGIHNWKFIDKMGFGIDLFLLVGNVLWLILVSVTKYVWRQSFWCLDLIDQTMHSRFQRCQCFYVSIFGFWAKGATFCCPYYQCEERIVGGLDGSKEFLGSSCLHSVVEM